MLVLFTLSFLLLNVCENPESSEYERKLTINGQLIAGETIDSIWVSWSMDITEKFDTEAQWVRNADVRINNVPLIECSDMDGVYYYHDRDFKVRAGETYRIEVRAQSENVYSETTVPPEFQFTPVGVSEGDTVHYIQGTSWFSDEFFSLNWGQYQTSQIYRIISLADTAAPDNFIEDDRNEANLFKGEQEDRDNPFMWWAGDTTAQINWMYFNWTGWHNVIVTAMDDNYYHYRNGLLFGEQSGQNFNSVVKNGYGLFCSGASDTIRVFLVE